MQLNILGITWFIDPRVAVILAYVLLILLGRALFVAWTTRRLLIAQIEGVRARVASEQRRPGHADPGEAEVAQGITRLLDLAEKPNPLNWKALPTTMILWNGARELQGWRLVHEAERLMVKQWDDEAVYSRIRRAQIGAAGLPKDEGTAWTAVLGSHLAEGKARRPEAARADLREALAALNNHTDTSFAALIELQNKATWLLWVGLMLVTVVAFAYDESGKLLLAGAIGGLLNRMRRIFAANEVPTDYGASWVPLFLSPVVGALTGWGGIQLLQASQMLDIVNLSALNLASATGTGALAAALGMGFAEQWFDQVSQRLEEQTAKQGASAGTPSTPAVPPVPGDQQ